MSLVLFFSGLGTLAAAFLLELAGAAGLLPTAARRRPGLASALGGLGAGGLVCAAGVAAVVGTPQRANLGDLWGLGPTLLRLDGLAGMFLALTGALAVTISATLVGAPANELGRQRSVAYLVLLGSVWVALAAGDDFSFVVAWEALTLCFTLLLDGNRRDRGADRRSRSAAALVTYGTGKLSGAAVLTGLLVLAGRAGSDSLAAAAHLKPGGLTDAAFALLVVGFGAKVGVVPFQVWMPRAYPSAPAPLRAAMAGLALNAGFYGLVRTLGLLGHPPVWLAAATLGAGALSALGGVAFAAVQSDLAALISLSSVEHAGLVVTGYGVALCGASLSEPRLVAAGLLAAMLQVLAHALGKTALFCAAGFFCEDLGTTSLDALRGVGRTHPFSAWAFGVGSLTLAGLPPTIGFVSEWFLFESLMQEFRVRPLELRLAMVAAGALVALTASLSALTFARVLSLSVLGAPTGARVGRGREGGRLGRAALGALTAFPLVLAACAPACVRFLAEGMRGVREARALGFALSSPFVLAPSYPGFSALSPSWLLVVLAVGFLAVGAGALVASRGRMLKVRRVRPWRSATPGVAGLDRYTSFGYANPLRHVLANVLGTRHEVVAVEDVTDAGRTDRAHLEVRSSVVEPVEAYLYGPARAGLLRLASLARRVQSGRLEVYVALVLVALVVMLAVAALA